MMMVFTLLLVASGLAAQQPASAAAADQTTATAADEAAISTTTASTETATAPADLAAEPQKDSYETRNQFSNILRRLPHEVATILVLDPTLLSNEEFVGGYPEIAQFLSDHPTVRRNPRFYLAEFRGRDRDRGSMGEFLEGLMIFSTFTLIAFALAWLVRTIVEQKRWNRLSRTQSEVHNKILDRFGSSEELLTYIKTPAGEKFLESAPIPLHADQAVQRTPMGRILWSVQLGVVVAVASLGLLLVSFRYEAETAQDLFAIGVIAFCVGAGFIGSAVVSLGLSRRLGLWQGSGAANGIDESGDVR